MSRPTRNYARFYYDEFIAEYPDIYADDAAFAAWMRLLTLAEKVWPALPELPRSVRMSALRKLVDAKLVLPVPNHCYRIRGLDAERSRRQGLAKSAADARWSANSSADGNADRTASAMPRRDEKETSTPLPPSRGGFRAEGTNPRAVAAAEAARVEEAARERRARRQARHLAYLDGRLTEAQRDDMDERDAPLDDIPVHRGAAYVRAS